MTPDTSVSSRELSCNSATRKELVDCAKEHYHALSDAACDFNSVVIKVLDHYAASDELRADVLALCDSTQEYAMVYDGYGHKACPFRACNAQCRDGYSLNHKPDCPVLIARRVREGMKAE